MTDLFKNVSWYIIDRAFDTAFTALGCMPEYLDNPKERYFEARRRSPPPETKDVRLKNQE